MDDVRLTLDSTLADVFEHPIGGPLVRQVLTALPGDVAALLDDEQTWPMLSALRMGEVVAMGVLPVESQQVGEMLEMINEMTYVAHGYAPLWRRPTGLVIGAMS